MWKKLQFLSEDASFPATCDEEVPWQTDFCLLMRQLRAGSSLLGSFVCTCKISSGKEVQPRKLDRCCDRPGRFYLAVRPQSWMLDALRVETSTDKLASLTEAELFNFVQSRHIPLWPMDVSTLTCKARKNVEKPSVVNRRFRAFALTKPFF